MIGELFGSAFIAICSTFQGSYNDACQKSLDATTRYIGIRQQAEFVENRVNVVVNQEVKKVEKQLPKQVVTVTGAAVYGYKVFKERRVGVRIPTLGVCSSARAEVGIDQYTLTIGWNF